MLGTHIATSPVSPATEQPREFNWWLLPAFLLLSYSAALGGLLFPPDVWYQNLAKPSWNPPAWLFGPVWTVLYLTIGLSAWLIHHSPGPRRAAYTALGLQWLLNAAWSPVFFGLHAPGLAFVICCLLWLAVVWTLVEALALRPAAAALLVPYWLWTSFALLLNGVLWLMN